MSSIPQNHSDEKDLVDCVQRFFSKHHVGKDLPVAAKKRRCPFFVAVIAKHPDCHCKK